MPNPASKELAAFLEPLTERQRIYVESRLRGLSKMASATAAGISNPKHNAYQFEKRPAVREAIRAGMEALATEVMFTRKKAHDMLMDAHRNAASTTEQVFAIKELIKLHGVAAPEVKELRHQVTGSLKHEEVRQLSDTELLKLAQLPPSELPSTVIEGEYESVERDGRDAEEEPDSSPAGS
jgi:phage terminase small subunit